MGQPLVSTWSFVSHESSTDVATAGQIAGLEAQVRELRAAGCDKIFAEQVSSIAERQQLEAALDYVRKGDQFVSTKLTDWRGR